MFRLGNRKEKSRSYMMNCASVTFTKVVGLDATKSALAVQEGDTMHFLVTNQKAPHYKSYCNEITSAVDPTKTIYRYCDHANQLYATLNLSLAADGPNLKDHGDYIQQLRASILSQPLLESCPLFRGCDLSQKEIDQMERLGSFFIPSFTSTSVDPQKAYQKSALLVVNAGYCSKYACSITPALSPFYNEEREVLLSCYTAFRLQRLECVNKQKIVSLWLDEYNSSQDRI